MAVKKLQQTGSVIIMAIVLVVVVTIVAGVLLLKSSSHKSALNPNSCVSQSFAVNSTGQCVTDIRKMVNPQAYGIDGRLYIPATGTYDTATVTAVKLFQKNFGLPQTGNITSADWPKLCASNDATPTFTSAASDADCQSL